MNTPGRPYDVALSADGLTAFVADGDSGLQVVDVSDTAFPWLLGAMDTPGFAHGVTLSADGLVAFVADDDAGLRVVDVSNRASPVLLGEVFTPGFAEDTVLSADGSIAFVADGGVRVVDVSNQASPVTIGGVETLPTSAVGIALSADGLTVFVADDIFLQAVDVSNLAFPVLLGSVQLTNRATDLTLSADGLTAFVADSGTLQVVDVSDAASPFLLGGLMTPGDTRGITLSADGLIAFVADGPGGLRLIGSPGDGLEERHFPPVSRLAAISGHLWVVQPQVSWLFDFSPSPGLELNNAPDNPLPATIVSLAVGPEPFHVSVLHDSQTLQVWDVQNRATPQMLGSRLLAYPTSSVVAEGDYLYALQDDHGIEVIHMADPLDLQFVTRIPGRRFYQAAAVLGRTLVLASDGLVYAPVLTQNQLSLHSGDTVILQSSNLAATDVDFDDFGLLFTVSEVMQGQFEVVGLSGDAITGFTQQNVTEGVIQFVHDGSVQAPRYQVSVSDLEIMSYSESANIIFNPLNDRPLITRNEFALNEGENVTITAAHLNATDTRIPVVQNVDLEFSVDAFKDGRFEVLGKKVGASITAFSQSQIQAGEVFFVHAGGGEPEYTLRVTDGAKFSLPSLSDIRFNDAPEIIENRLVIGKGERVTLSARMLAASDDNDGPSVLRFWMSDILHGQFEWANNVGIATNNFTQADVNQGAIQFVHNGLEHAPSYFVSVSDGKMRVGNESVAVVFSATTDGVLTGGDLVASIAGPVAAGIVSLGLLTAGIFAARGYWRDKKSRESEPFADEIRQALKLSGVDNFSTSEGQQYLLAVGEIAASLTDQGFDLDDMDRLALRSLAKEVAISAKSLITPNTTCTGYSHIQVTDLSTRCDDIAGGVLRLHGPGGDDQNMPLTAMGLKF